MIEYEQRGPIALIKIDTLEPDGPISDPSCSQLAAAWRTAVGTRSVRVAVIAGSWNWYWKASDTIDAPDADFALDELDNVPDSQLAVLRNVDFPKPIVAAVNGPCLSHGMEMLLATDIRVASLDAVFGSPYSSNQPAGARADAFGLARQIPYATAMDVLLTGRLMPAEEALHSGLINRMVDEAVLLDEAMGLAEMIAANSPVAVYSTKMSAVKGLRVSMDEAYEIERAWATKVFASEDAVEGPRAFLEKRSPRWADI
jgi:enoyl-CoA hydratase